MLKFPVAHYRKENSSLYINGGKFIITESEYILTYFFKTVARFPISKTTVRKAPIIQLYNGITFAFENECVHIYFLPKTAHSLYKHFSIIE